MSMNGILSRHGRASGVVAMLLVLACMLGAVMAQAAFAPQAQAADDEATLTLVVKHEEGGVNRSVSGAQFTAYRVAALGAGNRYELVEPFTGADVDFNEPVSVAASKAAAKAMAATAASKKPAGAKAATGTDGKAAFGALDMGVYLVVQTGATGVATKYTTMDAFLINVPQMQDGEVTYDVVASPKPELKPTSTTTQRHPKTGDTFDWGFVAGAAAIGLLAMCAAIAAARKRCRA